jgi:hypothetical protein
MTARAHARIDDTVAATAAADSAANLAANSTETSRVTQVRAAIAAGCYRPVTQASGSRTCVDALADWSIVTSKEGIAVKTGREAR